MLFDEIKQYAIELKVAVDSGIREGTTKPAEPVFLYGKDNTIFVKFSFSYWIMPDGTVEYRSRLTEEGARENCKRQTLLPLPPVSDAPALDGYIRSCERLLGLQHRDFDDFREAIDEFRETFERIAAMNGRCY